MALTEIPGLAEDDGPGRRRWYKGDTLELVVWTDDGGARQYQLRYARGDRDGVYEWRRAAGLFHYSLDDGESRAARAKATPILTPDAPGDLDWVRARFDEESVGLEPSLRSRVEETLAASGSG